MSKYHPYESWRALAFAILRGAFIGFSAIFIGGYVLYAILSTLAVSVGQ